MVNSFLEQFSSRFEEAESELAKADLASGATIDGEQKITLLSPTEIDGWEYRDRQDFELGDIDGLAESIAAHNQAQPIVVVPKSDIFRPKSDCNVKYVVIAGYRRWLACKSRDMKVRAVIECMSFDEAVDCLVTENEKKTVTDYGKGMFFAALLKREDVKKNVLYERLRIKRTTFNNYLAFSDVPADVWVAVGDLTKVSARTAGAIKSICERGEAATEAIISIAAQIRNGAGEKKVQSLVEGILQGVCSEKRRATRVAFSSNLALEVKGGIFKIATKNFPESSLAELEARLSEVLGAFKLSDE